jgi:hypothetical protein
MNPNIEYVTSDLACVYKIMEEGGGRIDVSALIALLGGEEKAGCLGPLVKRGYLAKRGDNYAYTELGRALLHARFDENMVMQ